MRGKEVEHIAGREVWIIHCIAHGLRDPIGVAINTTARRAARVCPQQRARDIGELAGALPVLTRAVEDHVRNSVSAAFVERAPVRLLRGDLFVENPRRLLGESHAFGNVR